ncbi:MAG: right-handed parallel beta-helix repeat-containing protein [bacterium]|nr:right-handed parallel beta-helix repeat-containing protein [bacterium]
MKKLIILFILLSSQLFAQYITPNTGVNWNLDDLVTNSGGTVTGTFPNYAINNKVTVSAQDRIYILPGSAVTFSGSASGFEIFGKFLAVGTPADTIRFSASVHDSLGGSFNGFYFRESSVDSACIISYTRIEYAYYGLRCLGASPTLSHSYLWKCRRGANLSSDSHPVITNNRIERSYEYGITMTTGCSPLIEYNELINNNSQNTSPKNQISIGTQGNNSPTIRYNIIQGGMFNRTGGISISTLISGSSSSSEIAHNEIYDNSFGIALQGSNPITSYIHNNLIYDNNINPDVMTSGSGINAYGTAVVAPIITRNKISGNWWGITIQIGIAGQPGPQVNLGNIENTDTTDDGRNIISGNIQGTDVYDLYNNTLETVYAQNNDWEVYDSLSIENHIYHFKDDSTLGLVIFIPFSSSIPVELTSFTAEYINDEVVLNWRTATETNNSGFEVERISPRLSPYQGEGGEAGRGWEMISFVEGRGTTTELTEYYYKDKIINPGKYVYRLKQIDFDGSFSYSNEVEIDVAGPKDFALYQNYPNPFNPTTTIKFALPVDSRVKINVYNSLGQLVETLVDKEMESGYHEVNFSAKGGSASGGDALNLASGVYLYQLLASEHVAVKKMLLLK